MKEATRKRARRSRWATGCRLVMHGQTVSVSVVQATGKVVSTEFVLPAGCFYLRMDARRWKGLWGKSAAFRIEFQPRPGEVKGGAMSGHGWLSPHPPTATLLPAWWRGALLYITGKVLVEGSA